ncbi:mechanosensitive ion channel family protein [Paenibacillus paeoniae]|uniref:Mechanosensitive ion channel family protein n=1 Tax=Paenibacillus paeoniae TaxID=2292705 RepID=A0A371P1Y8_9BACL|nr:mechanosensitive ion channel family protein [Paenibacillus paeoniae]REK69618.1 mechanosensitive ion channel family protein [Paenibacillus paeoniae]
MDWIMDKVEAWRLLDLGIAVGLFLLFLLFRRLFVRFLFAFLMRRLARLELAARVLEAFEKPLRGLFVLLGAYLAILYYIPAHWAIMLVVHKLFRSGMILLIGAGLYNLSAVSSLFMEGALKRFGGDDSSMLIPFLSKAVRFVVIVIAITAVVSEWGFNINGVVAGMGLGSLALALAAKDTLGNILGGVIIILEKPFSKGDWILTPSTEGVVEDITFRSSKIRTFADALVTVPNSTLADQPITNWSRMGRRRITFTLNVALDTEADRLTASIDRIEQYLMDHEDVDDGTIMVKFNEFKESSLGIMLYYFTKTTAWKDHLTVRQDTQLAMLQILKEEGVRLALPVQRVLIDRESGAARNAGDAGLG